MSTGFEDIYINASVNVEFPADIWILSLLVRKAIYFVQQDALKNENVSLFHSNC